MRTLAILGLAAIAAFQSASAATPMTVQDGSRWGGLPNLPLRPPANVAPAPRQWNGGAHWQGRTNWGRPDWRWAGWHHQGGGRFQVHHFRPRPGVFLPPVFISPAFHVYDWGSYGLAQPGYGQYWLRHGNDALLLDGRGYVYDMVPSVDWREEGPDDRSADYAYDNREAWYADDAVTCCGDYRLSYAPVVTYVPMGATTVIIQSPATVTTTSYVEEEVVRPAPKKVWKPKSAWKPRKISKPRPQCSC